MRKFLSKALFFVAGLLLLIQLLAKTSEAYEPWGQTKFLRQDQGNIERLTQNRQQIEAIVVGNSHSDAIDFDSFHYVGQNLGRAGGDLYEAQFIIENSVENLPKLHTVFMPISYFTFWLNNSLADSTSIRRLHLYAAMPSWDYIDGDLPQFILGKLHGVFPIMHVLREDSWKNVVDALMAQETAVVQAQTAVTENGCQTSSAAELATHAAMRAPEHIALTAEMRSNDTEIEHHEKEVLMQIADFLAQRNIRLVLYTPPYYQAYTETYIQYDAEMVSEMKHTVGTLTNVEYYDFSAVQELVSNRSLFFDSDHLNPCGAKAFTHLLKKEMENKQGLARKNEVAKWHPK